MRRFRGTSLAELLIAVTFLGFCVTAILTTLTTASSRAQYSKRRALILAQVEDQIAASRAAGRKAALPVGDTASAITVPPGAAVSIVKKTEAVTGYGSLYRVTVTATWHEPAGASSRSDSLTLETLVRAPDG